MICKLSAKDYLEQSAIEILSQKTIERVTVKDICRNCSISTRTFYKYYKDKYDIINTCFHAQLDIFFERHAENISLHNFLQYTADIVYKERNFFSNVFQYTGQNNIRMSLVEPLKAKYFRIIREGFHDEITPSIENAVVFFIRGQLSYIEEVLSGSHIPDSKTSVSYFENAIPAVLEKYL